MGCVQCKDKEATKLTDERDGSLNQSTGYRYGTDPTPQHYPNFGVTSIPNYNNFPTAGGQGLTVFGGVNSSSHTGTLRTRGGTGKSYVAFSKVPISKFHNAKLKVSDFFSCGESSAILPQ